MKEIKIIVVNFTMCGHFNIINFTLFWMIRT
jgi:hypothetical protein